MNEEIIFTEKNVRVAVIENNKEKYYYHLKPNKKQTIEIIIS